MPSRPDRSGRQVHVDLPVLPGRKGCRGFKVREGQEDFPVLRVPQAQALSFSCQSAIEDAVERAIVNALNFGGVVTVNIGLGCAF
jgi:hypothetical protein